MTDDFSWKHNQRVIRLQVCECNQLHLTYGSLTLHFDQKEFLRFASTVRTLADQIPVAQARREELSPPSIWTGKDNRSHA